MDDFECPRCRRSSFRPVKDVKPRCDGETVRGQGAGEPQFSSSAQQALSAGEASFAYQVEGTLVLGTTDLQRFLSLCDRQKVALMRAPAVEFPGVRKAVFGHFHGRNDLDAARAASDMCLRCPVCGHKWSERVAGLRGEDLRLTAEGACSRCGSSEALYLFDNWCPSEIGPRDIQALKAFYNLEAMVYFASSHENEARCSFCGTSITAATAYLVSGTWECPECIKTYFGDNFVDKLREDPCCVGRGVLRKARQLAAGKHDRKLVRVR